MNRKEFIQHGLALGMGLPFLTFLLDACSDESILDRPEIESSFNGKVLIIGAGAAGLTAGYILQKQGIDFEIIEAAPIYGGRVKRADNFIDLPLDLGAEWMHVEPSVLAEIVNDSSVDASIDFVKYTPKTIQSYQNGKLKNRNAFSDFTSEWKFKSTTWYGFFEQYIVPSIEDQIRLNQPVQQIDYSSDEVIVTTDDGTIYTGDKVLVTVPIAILKKELIDFVPALPNDKVDTVNDIQMDAGLKVAIEFKERFYPDVLLFDGLISNMFEDSKAYFDAVFGKDTDRNVLGLFAINENAAKFTDLGSDQAIIEAVIAELDEVFDGKASEHYVQHIVQNWAGEPYIQGSYSYTFDGNQENMVNTLAEPVDGKLYFAGEALSLNNQATVHGAAESAYIVVPKILQ